MTPDQAKEFVFNSLEPKLQEIGKNYLILFENKQFFISYSGDLIKIGYMLGQVSQDILQQMGDNEGAKRAFLEAIQDGMLDDIVDADSQEEF
jgi:hypothetical protein